MALWVIGLSENQLIQIELCMSTNHHTKQKWGLVNTLMKRAERISEPQYLQEEQGHMLIALFQNEDSRSL